MFTPEVISAGRVQLRPHEETDADAIARACADPLIAEFIPSVPTPYTRDDAVSFLQAAAAAWVAGAAQFAVADPVSGEWLGNIGLKPPDVRGNAEIGYLMAPWARGKGSATAATRALTAWAFARGVARVELLADVENVASQRVAYAAGFLAEGVQRGCEPRRDGLRHDMVSFARLAGDPGDPVRPYLPFPPGGSLTDGVVRLEPITVADAPGFHRMMTDPLVLRYHVPPDPPPFEEIAERCRKTGMWWLAGERAELAVKDAVTGEFAGHIQLMQIMPPLGQAMVGYSLLAGHRGRGFVTRAVNLLAGWAFEHTALHRIVAGTDPDNTASQRVLERAGFTRESVQRALLPGPDGTRRDNVEWARLRP
ncbi:GNAT family N-acetyltransferase [Streptosporangium sp. KLBMP 9127]|nr:GNAT family N-acetyltransferase [Streptosporangium sp. KLBMP 9127]